MSDNHHPLAGPTGKFPRGKNHPGDKGELTVVLTCDREKNLVRLDFGEPVAWLSIDPQVAREIAFKLLSAASKIDDQIYTITVGDERK